MGRKTFLSMRRPLPGRTNIVVTRDFGFRSRGALVTTSLPDALAIARADALRRSVAEIAVIGGAEIYTQCMDIADRLELTEVHARPEGDTRFPAIDRSAVGRGLSRAKSGRPGRQCSVYLCDISPTGASLTALGNVCIDFDPFGHSSKACVVSPGAVPYKAGQISEAGLSRSSPRRFVNAVEESGRRPMGLGFERALGLRSATSRTAAPRSGRPVAAWPGPVAAASARRPFQQPRYFPRPRGCGGDLGHVRILPGAVGRTRRRPAFRQVCPRRAARPELSFALSDRNRAAAESAARQYHLDRHEFDRRSRAPRSHHARCAGRKPDADGRREHRRRRLHGAVAHQAEGRRGLSVQYPEPRRYGEGGG